MKYRITMTRMLTMMLMDHLGDKKSLKRITLWAVVRPVFGINISRYISSSFQGISWISCAESETLSICKHALAYRDSRTNWSWSTTHTSGHEILLRRCSIQWKKQGIFPSPICLFHVLGFDFYIFFFNVSFSSQHYIIDVFSWNIFRVFLHALEKMDWILLVKISRFLFLGWMFCIATNALPHLILCIRFRLRQNLVY